MDKSSKSRWLCVYATLTLYIYIYIYVCVGGLVCAYLCVYVGACICMWVYVCTCVCECEFIYIYICVCVDGYRDIYTPLPPWGGVLWRRSNRVAISVYCKSLRSWIEVSATVERMYVNNSNCDSWPFKIYFAANISSWLND